MNKMHAALTAMTLLTLSTITSANQLVEASEERKLELADLVVVGTVVSINNQHYASLPRNRSAEIMVDVFLKGDASTRKILVQYASAYPETSYGGMIVGNRYLLYLSKSKDGIFASVNGRFGVYSLTNPSK